MATKTISIDADAYKRLKAARKGSESFSQTIKRFIKTPSDLLRAVESLGKRPMSDEAIEAVEQVVANRRGGARRSKRRAG